MINNMSKTIVVYISSDASTLGPEAVQEDLDRYAGNLAEHLVKTFPGKSFEVVQALGFRCHCTDSEVNEYVTELEASDAWVALC